MSSIPVDVITDILLRLPAKSLLRFKCVCKLWYAIINDSDFIRLHFQQSNNLYVVFRTPILHFSDFDTFANPTELDYPFKNGDYELCVEGSCRGLLFISVTGYRITFYLYNPTTRTHKTLPYLPIPAPFRYPKGSEYLGFGYDHLSEDYKCVRILQRRADDEVGSFKSQVVVYSLREDSWRWGAHDVPYYFYSHYGYCVDFKGTLHWSVEDDDRKPLPIVGFNLSDETFSSVPLPNYDAVLYMHAHMGVLDDCLCLMLNFLDCCDVWIMKEYGIPASWTKLFKFPKQEIHEVLRPISFSTSKKQMFVSLALYNVASVDLETLQTTNVQLPGFHKIYGAHVCPANLLVFKDVDLLAGTQQQRKKKRNK